MKYTILALLILSCGNSKELNSKMGIKELLNKHREAYLKFFESKKSDCDGASEALLEMKNDEQEKIYRLYRFDCLGRNEDDSFKIIEFNNDTYLNHQQIEFEYEGLQIELSPFFWNGCEIHFKEKEYKFESYIEWVKKWIDIEDKSEKNTEIEFSELIHNAQPPEFVNEVYTLSIDFGTSKVESFLELFRILKGIGVNRIKIDSKSMFEV